MSQQFKLLQGQKKPEVFRVIDDGTCVLTTMDPYKALCAMKDVLEKHDVTEGWVDFEILQ